MLASLFRCTVGGKFLAAEQWDARRPQLLLNDRTIDSNVTAGNWLQVKLLPKVGISGLWQVGQRMNVKLEPTCYNRAGGVEEEERRAHQRR